MAIGDSEDQETASVDRGTLGTTVFVLEHWGVGGTEAYVGSLARGLGQYQGEKPHLVVLGSADEDRLAMVRGYFASVSVLGCERRAPPLRHLNRIIRDLRPAICHLHLYRNLFTVAANVRALSRARLVVTLHSPLWQWSWRHRFLMARAIALSHAVIGVSSAVLRSVPDRVTDNGRKAWVVNPAVAVANVVPVDAATELGLSGADFVVGGCGRLSREKDWPTLLHAVQATRERLQRRVGCVVIGDGPELSTLQALASDLGLTEDVVFTGAVSMARAHELMAGLDVFVLPSLFEGFGIAPVEAMMLGVPVVTSRYPASDDYIEDGVTGLRFPIGDVEDLAGHIFSLASEGRLVARLTEGAQAFARDRFSQARVAGLHADIYRYCLSVRGGLG